LFDLEVSLKDILDILVVAFIVYELLVMIRGTRAVQMLMGLLLLVLASILAELARLPALSFVFGNLGQNRFIRFFIGAERNFVDAVVEAAGECIRQKIGALVVFEYTDGLRYYIERGVKIGAQVTPELLVTIFTEKSPLHDGATIIRNGMVASAGSMLPLADPPGLSRRYGARHRAAIGISEESDAVALVVSEERQVASIARNGKLTEYTVNELGKLRSDLVKLFGVD
jgi:diadenylate cyclase